MTRPRHGQERFGVDGVGSVRIGPAVNVTFLTYADTYGLGVDIDTGAIPDFEEFCDCLVAGFDEVLALADG